MAVLAQLINSFKTVISVVIDIKLLTFQNKYVFI